MGAHPTFLYALSTANFVWLLGGLCQAHRVPWDSAEALQTYPPPHTIATLCAASERHGMRIREAAARATDWPQAAYPLIAFRRVPDGSEPLPLLVTLWREDRVQYFAPALPGPLAAAGEEFAAGIEPVVLIVFRGDRSLRGGNAKYGLRDFLREALGFDDTWRRVAGTA